MQANVQQEVHCIKYRMADLKLIAYTSKRLPEAAKNSSITELELCGLAINIASFSHLLKRVDFDARLDHLSLTHIIKSKAEPATIRIKRLLELISSYSFNIYYTKVKDLVLSDFLSRQNNDDRNPHQIISIPFNVYQVPHEKYYNKENYLVQTQSQTRFSGIKLPEVHGMGENLDPNIKPEKQHANPIKGSVEKACIGQGKAGLRWRRLAPMNQTIISPSELSQKIPGETKIETGKINCVNSKDPTHSINNTDEGMTHKTLYSQMFPSIQVQLTGPLLNPLDPICLDIRRVHKVHLVQKILP